MDCQYYYIIILIITLRPMESIRVGNVSHIVLDLTDEINKLSINASSAASVIENLVEEIQLNTLFYEADCQRVEECIHQIAETASSLHTILNKINNEHKLNQTIVFSIPITESNVAFMRLDSWKASVKIESKCYQIAVAITWKIEESCLTSPSNLETSFFNIRSALKQAFHPELRVGLGFYRRHLMCKLYSTCFNMASFFVITEEIGYGDVDAYVLSAKRINTSYKKPTASQVTKKEEETWVYRGPSLIIRHTNINMFGEYNLQKELWAFSQALAQDGNELAGLLLSPSAFKPRGIGSNAYIIGVINHGICFENVEGCYWLHALEMLIKAFHTFVLDYGQWESINSVLKNPGFPHAIIDFSLENDCGLAETQIKNLFYNSRWSENFKVTALIVPNGGISSVSNKGLITDCNVLKNVTVLTEILCPITILPELIDKAISVAKFTELRTLPCVRIGATNFILEVWIDIMKGVEMNFSNSFFNAEVLNSLKYALKVREHMWRRNPSLNPHIKIRFDHPNMYNLEEELRLSIFCNRNALNLNKLFEKVQVWSSFRGFPIIIKSAISSSDVGDPSSWLTTLMPSFLELSNDFFTKQYPVFVLRDFPQAFDGFVSEPCIEWAQVPPKIGDDFFLNTVLGVTLSMNIPSKETVTNREFETIFKFLFHKFQMVEILVTNINEASIIREMISNNSITTIDGDNRSQIFVDILLSENKNDSFNTLFMLKTHLKLGGVILNVFNIDPFFQNETYKFSPNNTRIDYINTLVDFATNIGDNVGIAFELCEKLLPEILRNESTRFLLLDKIQYLVCYSTILVNDFTRNKLAEEFDKFLYIQITIARHYPSLQLAFRIYPLVRLNENTLDNYVIFLHYLKQLGSIYNIRFFPVRAFDSKTGSIEIENGWWTIENYNDLSNVSVFFEKESVHSKRETWRPSTIPNIIPKPATKISLMTIILISSLSVLLLLGCFIGVFVCIRYKRMKLLLSDKEVREILDGKLNRTDEGIIVEGQFENEHLSMRIKFDFNYELAKGDITIDFNKILGFGHFGTVFKGSAKGQSAAIKAPSTTCSATTLKTFLHEINVLCYIGNHPNIVNFVGAYIREVRKGILQVATEWCCNGSLESFLRRKKLVNNLTRDVEHTSDIAPECVISIYEMHRFCSEIASGMEHIGKKQFIHGDLAARNILLDSNLTCKICDFGLSRKLYNYETYIQASQVPLPWRWAAYEVLSKREFSMKSDVWSFGVTIWEILTLGKLPFAELDLSAGFPTELNQGLRLSQPEYASAEIHSKLQDCWSINPEERPDFEEIGTFFKTLCRDQYSTVTVFEP